LIHKVTCKIGNTSALEIEVVHVHIQALAIVWPKVFLGILEEKGRFAYASSAFDANHTIVPVNLIHQGSSDWSICMLN
jgi:hypothetical protein